MEPIFIEATQDTPEVKLDKGANAFQISGRSYPENADTFFDPIIDWMESYVENPNADTLFEFRLYYFNTASSKHIYNILFMLQELNLAGHKVKCVWYFEDDDEYMEDLGEELSEMVELEFEFILEE